MTHAPFSFHIWFFKQKCWCLLSVLKFNPNSSAILYGSFFDPKNVEGTLALCCFGGVSLLLFLNPSIWRCW